MSEAGKGRPVVYYNSGCPVCKAGIDAQREHMAACEIEWKDVHTDAAARTEIDSPLEFVRKRLHAVDENGKVHVGIEAALLIWRRSPGEAWKARLLGLPLVRQFAGLCYNGFAWLLYRWNLRHGRWRPEQ